MRRWPVLALVALLLAPGPGLAQEEEAKAGYRWIPPSAWYGHWVLLFQPYWSGLDGFGAGLELTRPFSVSVLSDLGVEDIEVVADARLYEDFHGQLEVTAETRFSESRWSTIATLLHSTRLRRFWGVGPDLDHEAREEYRPRDLRAYAELLRRFGQFRIGGRFEVQDYQYIETEPGGLLETGDYPDVTSGGVTVYGFGLVIDRDSRDDRYNPRRGWWIQGFAMRFEHYADSTPEFWNLYADVRTYLGLTDHDVLALQAFTYGVTADAPIWRYAAIGGREHTRGYSRNRYLDQKMVALQAEWRRPLVGDFDFQLFGSVATVAPTFDRLSLHYLRPTWGAGLSVPIPMLSRIPVRGELAIGDESLHADLSIGFAF